MRRLIKWWPLLIALLVLSSGLTQQTIPLSQIRAIADNSIVGNNSGSSASPSALTGAQATALLSLYSSSDQGIVPATGAAAATNVLRVDGTWGTVQAGAIANNAVQNTKLSDMPQSTVKCRVTASTGDPQDCTSAQMITVLGADLTEASTDAFFGLTFSPSDTIAFLGDDNTDTWGVDVKHQMTIVSDANGIKIANDEASPGNSEYYGTNGSGTKGYFPLPSAGAITNASASLGADVQMATTNQWYDGPSVSLEAGTWLVSSHTTVQRNATTAETIFNRVTDGTNHYASSQAYHPSASGASVNIALTSIIILDSTTTIKIQSATSAGATTVLMKAAISANGSGNNATKITAIKLQ